MAASFLQQLQQASGWLRYPAMAATTIAAIGSGTLYVMQNELIYPRGLPAGARTDVPKPSAVGVADFEELKIPTPDGAILHAYYVPAANLRPRKPVTVLMFHGNAGNIGHLTPIARVLSQIGVNVLMLEYRGYGLSTGKPDENGLMIDAQSGLDYIRNKDETKNTKIVIYGQSLGGAVSIYLVGQNKHTGDIAGLILENTFTSIRDLIPSVFPPARYISFLCTQKWPSISAIPFIKDIPILFLSGLKDEIVPPSHMKKLYEASKAKIKIWKPFPEGRHNETVAEAGYFFEIEKFIDQYVLGEKE